MRQKKGPFFIEFVCQWCQRNVKEEVSHFYKTKKLRQFCSRTCVNKHFHFSGILDSKGTSNPMFGKTVKEQWTLKYGTERAAQLSREKFAKQSKASAGEQNPMFGRSHSDSARQKMSKSRKGKTLGEMWRNFERADEFKRELSQRMKGSGNHMYGKTSSGGRSIKGTYKGFFFRSLLEWSFMKFLESQSFSLESDVEYEPFHIPVSDSQSYCPDFFVAKESVVYEVKPFWSVELPVNVLKFAAAEKFCQQRNLSFRVMTERDFPKLTFEQARSDQDVVLDERTFKYFQRDHP